MAAAVAAGVVLAGLAPSSASAAASASAQSTVSAREEQTVAAARGWRIQLAAYRSRERALAAWRRLVGAQPDLLAVFTPMVERADLGAQMGVFFRLRIGPFADAAGARTLCQALKARKVDCIVVRPTAVAAPAPKPAAEAEPPAPAQPRQAPPPPPGASPMPAPPPSTPPSPAAPPTAVAPAPASSPPAAPERVAADTASATPKAGGVRGRFSGFIAPELRVFPREARFPGQAASGFSIAVQPEYFAEWDDGRQNVAITGFARLDQHDGRRSRLDLREARWRYLGDDWSLRVGVDKVFWGALESEHLVDIINQTDLIENPDGEDKLGQPMVSLALDRRWGTTELFVMPYFRERTFPGVKGRLRTQLPVDVAAAEYASGAERYHPDVALRWSGSFGPWDVGLAHFYGTSREPRFLLRPASGGGLRLVPRYDLINQTSFDAQGAFGDWLLKIEAMTRTGHGGERIFAIGGGFEYTFGGVLDSDADLGVLVEVLYDDRNDDNGSTAPPTLFDHDVFTGLRLSFNDVDSTDVLAGVVTDWRSGARAISIEANRRIGERVKIGIEARTFDAFPSSDFFNALSRDDYLQFTFSYYF